MILMESIFKNLDKEIEKIEHVVLSDSLDSLERIKFFLGIIKGLKTAKNLIINSMKENINVN